MITFLIKADGEGIEPSPPFSGLVFKTSVAKPISNLPSVKNGQKLAGRL